MARYRKVSIRIHGDDKVRRLSVPPPNGRDCWWYLLTARESTNIPGLIPAGAGALADSLRWDRDGFLAAFGEVEREGLALADWTAQLIWIPNAVHHNEPESPNVVVSWGDTWDDLIPDCPLKAEAWVALREYCEARGPTFLEAFEKACRKPSMKARPMVPGSLSVSLPGRVTGSLPGSLAATIPAGLPESGAVAGAVTGVVVVPAEAADSPAEAAPTGQQQPHADPEVQDEGPAKDTLPKLSALSDRDVFDLLSKQRERILAARDGQRPITDKAQNRTRLAELMRAVRENRIRRDVLLEIHAGWVASPKAQAQSPPAATWVFLDDLPKLLDQWQLAQRCDA
jgi:hypothetical protein